MYVDAYGMCRHEYVHVYVCMLMYECMDIGTFVCIHVHVSRCVCVSAPVHACNHACVKGQSCVLLQVPSILVFKLAFSD